MKISKKFSESVRLCWLLTIIAVLYSVTPIHNGNIFWHLRNGIDIVETGEITLEDESQALLNNPKIREAYLGE